MEVVMSHHDQNQDAQLANFVGVVLTLIFIMIFVLISAGSGGLRLTAAAPASGDGQVVAQAAPTNTLPPTTTPQASATMLASTPTVMPMKMDMPTTSPDALNTPSTGDTAAHTVPGHTAADYDPALAALGEPLFAQCAACHGPDARGLPNLG